MVAFPFFLILMVIFALLVRLGGLSLGRGRLKVVLMAYALVLAASLAVLYMLPPDRFDRRTRLSSNEFNRIMDLGSRAYTAAAEGRLDEMPEVLGLRKWEFELDGETLALSTTGERAFHLMVVAERKKEADGLVEVTYHATPTLLDGIDVTGDLKPPDVEMKNGVLRISMPGDYQVEIGQFIREFIISPLLDNENREEGFPRTVIGAQILRVKVPANARVEPGKAVIDFIDRTGE